MTERIRVMVKQMKMKKLSYRSLFYLIMAIALIVRIYFVFFTNFSWIGSDSEMYLKMGAAIVDGSPLSYFPNGYPLLIALVIYFFGSNNQTVLVIINIIAQLATLVLAERILNRLGVEEKFRLVILFIIAFYPAQVSGVRFIMTEPFSLLLIMLSIYFFYSGKYYLSGFTSYLAYAFRPSLILFTPLVIIYQLYKQKKLNAGFITLGFASCLVLFFLAEVTGLTSSSDNQTQNILVSIQSYGYTINHSFSNFTVEQIEHPVKTYINFIFSDPIVYLEQRLLSLWSLWGPYVPSDLGFTGMVLHGLRFPFFILSVIVFMFRNNLGYNRELLYILFVPVISVTVIHFFFFSTQRHQFPAEPFAIILSLIGVQYFLQRYRLKHQTGSRRE